MTLRGKALSETAMALLIAVTIGSPARGDNEREQTMQRGTAEFTLQMNLIIVDVEVNGTAGQFILDTGASTTMLAKSFADGLGLKEADRSAGAGAGGVVTITMVRVETLTVAGMSDHDISCPVMDISAIRSQVGENIDGVLGFDFFGRGTMLVDYPNRRVTIERPMISAGSDVAIITNNTVRLQPFGVEIQIPSSDWRATTETPLPSIPVILHGPHGAKITASVVHAHGLSMTTMKGSLDASAGAQVEAFERIESSERKRAGRATYRLEYFGTSDRVRKRFISESILFDDGLLVLTCEAPVDVFESLAAAVQSAFDSVRFSEGSR